MSRAATPRIEGVFKNVRRVMRGEVLKRLRTYEWDREVIPGIVARATPGHTPGHTCHIVTSGSSSVYVQADLTHCPFLFVRNPGWHPFVDHDPVQAEAGAARFTICSRPIRCWSRASTILSRPLPMSKGRPPATGMYRCPGALSFDAAFFVTFTAAEATIV